METSKQLSIEFKETFLATSPRVYSFLKKLLRDEETVKDCMQQCYLKLWETFATVHDRTEILPLLFTYSRNIAIDTFRKGSRYVHLEALSSRDEELKSLEAVHVKLETKEEMNALARMIKNLPDRQREVFQMIRMDGCSYRETAATLKLAVSTVEKHMLEANKKLGVSRLPAIKKAMPRIVSEVAVSI
jgi:RNA polymerase sigma-19 factor, ECF subfamily